MMSTTAELMSVDPVSDRKAWDALLAALGEDNQPAATLARVEELYQREVGAIIFTVMSADFDTGMSRRLYSNHPEEYPTSGYKQSAAGKWNDLVFGEKKPYVANTIEEIATVFHDHELIQSLGCGSCINVPIVFEGSVLGTVNILDKTGAYTPDKVERAMALRPFAAIGILAATITEQAEKIREAKG
ncbi:GAF domain-containing protein [Kaistia nematophila]|uniref:GAF domain-containing protein n=1 Tax=Kaistia nematophila TaxID=2994654 RepID=A0A9X3IJH4_9HYPH|nr:GAF domain-containing protein [Kaistia nematophila]MCX5568458.1 GAF domain-containing protein [Kaistia nematophila]